MRRLARWVGALLVLSLVAGACGGSSHHTGAKVPTPRISIPAPVKEDDWRPPSLAGPPSPTTFCTGLIADYRHTQGNAIATTTKVKKQILGDFVSYTPKLISAAPAEVSASAASYLGAEVKIVQILLKADLNAAKAPRGSIGDLLFNGQVRTAGVALAAYAEAQCHFDITRYQP